MIDLSSFTCVELGNYIKHQKNSSKLIRSLYNQKRGLEDESNKIIEEFQKKIKAKEKRIVVLQKLLKLDEKPLYRPSMCDTPEKQLQFVKSAIVKVISGIYESEIIEIDGLYRQIGNRIISVILVNTDLDLFWEMENCCNLAEKVVKAAFEPVPVEVNIGKNDNFLEISIGVNTSLPDELSITPIQIFDSQKQTVDQLDI